MQLSGPIRSGVIEVGSNGAVGNLGSARTNIAIVVILLNSFCAQVPTRKAVDGSLAGE